MKTLDKYVLREMMAPFLISVLAFVVLLIGRVIFDNIEFIIETGVPIPLVIQLIVFELPRIIGMVLPLAVLLALRWRSTALGATAKLPRFGWPGRRSGAYSCPSSPWGYWRAP